MKRAPICLGALLLVALANGPVHGQAKDAALNSQEIAALIGSEAEARGVFHALFRSRPTALLLARQIQPDWLPPTGSATALLSDADAATLLAQCGTYYVIDRVSRSGDVVTLMLRRQCAGEVRGYTVSFDGREWLAAAAGIGSGFVGGPPPECVCVH
jgi:hypothetical protein